MKDNFGRSELLSDWQNSGGIMIMGYEMFRNLSQLARVKNKKQKKIFTESLLDPGTRYVGLIPADHSCSHSGTSVTKKYILSRAVWPTGQH